MRYKIDIQPLYTEREMDEQTGQKEKNVMGENASNASMRKRAKGGGKRHDKVTFCNGLTVILNMKMIYFNIHLNTDTVNVRMQVILFSQVNFKLNCQTIWRQLGISNRSLP